MTKSVDWNEEIAKLHKDYSDEGALKLYNSKFEESSLEDTSLDIPSFNKRLKKTAFYALGAVAAFTSMCLLGNNPSIAIQVPAVIAGLIGTTTMMVRTGQTVTDTMDYPDRMKLWNKQQEKAMEGMTEEEKNAYKINYVKEDISSKENNKFLGVDGFNKDLQQTLKVGSLGAAAFSIPAVCAGGLALSAGTLIKDTVMNKISSIRKSISGEDNISTPKNTI